MLENITFQEFDISDAELQEIQFSLVTFTKIASFADTKFNNKVEFKRTTFQNKGIFRSTKFDELVFLNTSFQYDALFDYATFQKKAHFGITEIKGEAGFSYIEFKDITVFPKINFYGKTDFILSTFYEETKFHNVLFKNQEETLFDIYDLSTVSFRGADITKVRFSERVVWWKNPKDRFKLIDEYHLEKSVFPLFSWNNVPGKDEGKLREFLKKFSFEWLNINSRIEKNNNNTIIISSANNKETISIEVNEEHTIARVIVNHYTKYMFTVKIQTAKSIINRQKNRINIYDYSIRLGTVLAIYRNLRENYEYRLRFDEAGNFFIKEMELKRKYREVLSNDGKETIVTPNCWFRRNLSLTGLYYHLSRYGEDLLRPTLTGIVIISLSTFFWLIQTNPTNEPSFSNVLGMKHLSGLTFFLIKITDILFVSTNKTLVPYIRA